MNHRAVTSFFSLNSGANWSSLVFPILAVVMIVAASILLYLPVFSWLLTKMSLANGYLHLMALLGLFGLGMFRLVKLPSNPFRFPVLFHPGGLIWISASVLYLFNEANVGFHTLSGALFIVYLYGLAGHFLSNAVWRSMLLPMSLTILVLPFEHYLDVYLGFPLRLLSAEWAGSLLQFTGLPLMTVESILMVDNKAAVVDLDCSGINSLWIGLIFYLLLTWVERYAITLRWALFGLAFMVLLVLANVFRIVLLVMLDLVFAMPELAQLFHQSFGLLGFVISCLIIWWGLQKFAHKNEVKAEPKIKPRREQRAEHKFAPNILASAIILILITGFVMLYQPYQAIAEIASPHTLNLPPEYPVEITELSRQETDFFVSNNAQAQKYMIDVKLNSGFQSEVIKASMILVWSRAWKTHHVPENCYLSQGYSISDKGLWSINQQHNLRYLALDKPSTESTALRAQTGVYWFQSASNSTPDYSSRVMDNFSHPGREWVMVSILWDRPVNPDQISNFISTLKQSLASQFNEI